MLESAAHLLELILFELLLFSGFWFFIGALDDFCVDLIWLCRRGYRHLLYYRHNKADNRQCAITRQKSRAFGDIYSQLARSWGH